MTPQELATLMAEKTDQQLQDIFARPNYWTPHALNAARVELQKRNLTTKPEPTPSVAHRDETSFEHQYNNNGLCKRCGRERQMIDKTQRTCISDEEMAQRSLEKERISIGGELQTCKKCGERVEFDEYGFCPKCGTTPIVTQKTEQHRFQSRGIAPSLPKMPRVLWFILAPTLCVLGFALIHGIFFEESLEMRTLEEPAYTDLKREIEAEGVEVQNIGVKIGGATEGVFHGNEAIGATSVYLDIVLNKPDEASANETSVRVVNRFEAFAKSGKLNSVVERKSDTVIFLNIQYWKPNISISRIQIHIPSIQQASSANVKSPVPPTSVPATPDAPSDPRRQIIEAMNKGDAETVCKLARAHPELYDTKAIDNRMPLHYAAGKGPKDLVELLLAKGADANARANNGGMPLHYAAELGNKGIAELLLAKGADVNAKNVIGATPLYQAVDHNQKDLVELLLSKGADGEGVRPEIGLGLAENNTHSIQRSDMSTTDHSPTKGFAILIKAPGTTRHFVPREGETITITDKDGKQLWSIKVPSPIDNPGVIIHQVQIDLLTERDFGHFCQKTWNRNPTAPPETHPSAGTNPS